MAINVNSSIDPLVHIEHLIEHQLIVCKECRYAVYPRYEIPVRAHRNKWVREIIYSDARICDHMGPKE